MLPPICSSAIACLLHEPPMADTEFWLVFVSPGLMAATYDHRPIPHSLIFVDLIRRPIRRHSVPPACSAPATRPPQNPIYRKRRLSNDCCVYNCKMAATLRPWHPPSSVYFSTTLISTTCLSIVHNRANIKMPTLIDHSWNDNAAFCPMSCLYSKKMKLNAIWVFITKTFINIRQYLWINIYTISRACHRCYNIKDEIR
jgi:hypothetical protein